MTRIVSYNILAGGYSLRAKGERRTKQLVNIIRSANPDIVGVVEATHPRMKEPPLVVEEIAKELGMRLVMGSEPRHDNDYQIALLTRLPVIYTKLHPRPGLLNRPLLEVGIEEENGQQLTAFVTHLTAAFHRGRGGGHIRMREAREILKIMAPLRQEGKPHFIMGDFNSLAPGDVFKASHLVRYIVKLDNYRKDRGLADGHPQMDSVVPPKLRFIEPVLRIIPNSQLLCNLFDAAAALYAPRGCIRLLREAGYVDCYRRMHARDWGFTCPAAAPAGRIDYIFASPGLAERLEMCQEIVTGNGTPGEHASDHLAVTAKFGLGVEPPQLADTRETVSGTTSG
ncbi:MAG: endonuclease/exonuclease/phosphatase family protein [Ktedonobacteraceae bacterium]|nr:endonuclease/exonuclease/phosphatase family protein [Ktedonobacteraceae bacterium]